MNERIGLIDIDCHATIKKNGSSIYPNLALCKIAAYHKKIGDKVEWYDPLLHEGKFDKVYMSKIFNYSADFMYNIDAKEIIKGGTGYSIDSMLPRQIDDMQPDYSIYPSMPTDISYGFLTRGCPNKCKWCVVPKKEGDIHPYWDIERVANGNKKIILMDNNILAAGDYCMDQLQKIIDFGFSVDFNQALDARLVNSDNAKLLAKIRWLKRRIRFGCDTKQQIDECSKAMDLLKNYGFKGEFFLYTMLHGAFDECYSRINHWKYELTMYRETHGREGYNVYSHAQPYRDPYNAKSLIPQWQKDLARWANKRQLFWSIDFEDYEPRKGFKCSYYLQKQQN